MALYFVRQRSRDLSIKSSSNRVFSKSGFCDLTRKQMHFQILESDYWMHKNVEDGAFFWK